MKEEYEEFEQWYDGRPEFLNSKDPKAAAWDAWTAGRSLVRQKIIKQISDVMKDGKRVSGINPEAGKKS